MATPLQKTFKWQIIHVTVSNLLQVKRIKWKRKTTFIFYGLFLIKKENAIYQFNILSKQKALSDKNAKIEKQKENKNFQKKKTT